MTVVNTNYIQTIDRTGVNPAVGGETFNVTISYSGEVDILVWYKDITGEYVQQHSGTHFEVLESSIKWLDTVPVCKEIRIQRNLLYDQPESHKETTADNLETCLDNICMKGQQQIQFNTDSPANYNAMDDRISNVSAKTLDDAGYAATKAQVDSAIGTGTPWLSTDAGNVGKYAKHTGSSAGGIQAWDTLSGHADPRGKENNYLTADGWKDWGDIPAVGSGNNSKVLKDASGIEEWTAINEFPAGGTFGQILHRDNDEDPDAAEWRDSAYTPTPLGGKKYQTVRRNTSNKRHEWGNRFFLSKDYVDFDHNTGITGLGEWSGPIGITAETGCAQHRTWIGTITHPYGAVPSFVYPQATVGYIDFVLWVPDVGDTEEPIFWKQPIPYVLNVVSVSTTELVLAASTLIHTAGFRTGAGNYNLFEQQGKTAPGWTSDNVRFGTNINLSVTTMWYFDE